MFTFPLDNPSLRKTTVQLDQDYWVSSLIAISNPIDPISISMLRSRSMTLRAFHSLHLLDSTLLSSMINENQHVLFTATRVFVNEEERQVDLTYSYWNRGTASTTSTVPSMEEEGVTMHSAHGPVEHPREATNQSLLPTNLKNLVLKNLAKLVSACSMQKWKRCRQGEGVGEYEKVL